MPYIREEFRISAMQRPINCGELNYKLTLAIIEYMTRNGLSYQTLNDIVGALESCKAEFQRRVVAPYEDQKIRENGEVYPTL